MKKIQKVLIANRGEIARRILRTLKKMNIISVAVYSDADKDSLHVREADEAYYIGASPSTESYLKQDVLLELCLKHSIDAVHPGYGFLSENSVFAQKITEAGIIFIGPSPDSIEIMGDKLSAKQAVAQFNVPLVPGIDQAISSVEEAKEIAQKVGYPILIKASAGGGGKGMRLVTDENELESQMKMAQSEAKSSFGNDAVFVEKFVDKPRHIEIQVFGDHFGNHVYLFERECSIQRRHQKVIEEAPSSIVSPELRRKMGEAAVNVCKSCNYVGAGTVEFLLDAELNFYFLEMNTRLQVEHPVTEEITGLDLVEWQINVAMNLPLPKKQEELKIKGHAVEIRLYAEDTFSNFTPDVGKLVRYRIPSDTHLRVDDAFEEGMEIPIYYDPMIAKVITWGETRDAAISKMIKALNNYQVAGIKNNLDFCLYVLKHKAFVSGDFDTNFIKTHFQSTEILKESTIEEETALLHGFETLWQSIKKRKENEFISRPIHGAWKLMKK